MVWLGIVVPLVGLVASFALLVQRWWSRRQLERAMRQAEASQKHLDNKINELAVLMGVPPREY